MKLTTLHCTLAILAISVAAPAQFHGTRLINYSNPTGSGNSTIPARVYYPATTTGPNAPLKVRSGGYPVIVLLHAFNFLGDDYDTLASSMSDRDFVLVMPNTARTLGNVLFLDGVAMFKALEAANVDAGHVLRGAYDMTNAGIIGHSMGGGAMFRVLGVNPGYRAGFGLAPANQAATMPNVRVPFGLIHGTGDFVIGWNVSQRMYDAGTGYQNFKMFYLFNNDCDHFALAGMTNSPATRAVSDRSLRVMNGFFDRFLKHRVEGLEEALGVTARQEPRRISVSVEVRAPELWAASDARIGQPIRLTTLGEPGLVALCTANGPGRTPTPFGDLLLDPASFLIVALTPAGNGRLMKTTLTIPNRNDLIGARVPLQSLALSQTLGYRLTNSPIIEIK